MNILFIGDIVGFPGRRALKDLLPAIRDEYNVDVCIANAENSAAGMGISQKIAIALFDIGVDIITLGNHSFARADFLRFADSESRIVRPANASESWPGNDYAIVDVNDKGRLMVINLLGRVGMNPANSPYTCVDRLLDLKASMDIQFVMVDFHAEASSEKVAMGYYLDGRVSAVVGTHTHVQTADEKILPKGTAHISDVGMTGVAESVLGMNIDTSLRRLVDQLPASYECAEGHATVNAVFLEFDKISGLCKRIERINRGE